MIIQNISVKRVIKSKWTYIFVICLIILITLFVIGLNSINIYLFGAKVPNIFDKLLENNNIFNMRSYYANMDVTIISKNINSYNVKEWYSDSKYAFIFLDANKNKVKIILSNNNVYISNEGERSLLKLNNYIDKNTNLLSINTFITLYKDIEKNKNNCSCKSETREKKDEIIMTVEIKQNGNINCKSCELLKELNLKKIKIELILDKKTKLPKDLCVYNENNEESIIIVYNEFIVNERIDENIFKIN